MKSQRGFSMVEVLVSMLIIMFGLLGIVGMQLTALSNTDAARYNSVAAVFASDLASRIQGNLAYWATPPNVLAVASQNGSLSIAGGPTPSFMPAPDCSLAPCSQSDMAYFDLSRWGGNLISTLPGASANLQCNSKETPAVCALTISWIEKNVGLANPTGTESAASGMATGTTATHSFQTLISVL